LFALAVAVSFVLIRPSRDHDQNKSGRQSRPSG
jgi:hypothetical protein